MVTSFPMVLFSSNKKFNCSGIPSILKPKSLSFLTVEKEWKIHRHVLLSTWCHAHCLFDNVFAVLKKLYRRSYGDSLNQLHILCRADFTFGNAMSLVIQPGGLSESRREYLYLYRETVCEIRVLGCYSPAIVEISRDVWTDVFSDLIKPCTVLMHSIFVVYV